ncbi:MAG: hypothetical protein EAX81_04370 [Candidatus Thorarchaeota archaeon]|nr:hypothetical protein [Candidatus Thorarchaeota archaeon]
MESIHDEIIHRSRKWGSLIDLCIFILFSQPKFTIMVYPPPPPVYVPPQLLVIYMSICLGLLFFLLWAFSLSASTESFLVRTALLYIIAGLPMAIGYFVDEPALSSLLGTVYLFAGYLITVIASPVLIVDES